MEVPNEIGLSPYTGLENNFSFATNHTKAPSGLTCRPRLLPMPTSGQSVAETLQAMKLRWVASTQPDCRGTARLRSEMSASLPALADP